MPIDPSGRVRCAAHRSFTRERAHVVENHCRTPQGREQSERILCCCAVARALSEPHAGIQQPCGMLCPVHASARASAASIGHQHARSSPADTAPSQNCRTTTHPIVAFYFFQVPSYWVFDLFFLFSNVSLMWVISYPTSRPIRTSEHGLCSPLRHP